MVLLLHLQVTLLDLPAWLMRTDGTCTSKCYCLILLHFWITHPGAASPDVRAGGTPALQVRHTDEYEFMQCTSTQHP